MAGSVSAYNGARRSAIGGDGLMVEKKKMADLAKVLDILVQSGHTPDTEECAKVAEAIAHRFSVDPDEVAILALSPKKKTLRFIVPEKLAPVGTIPLTSTSALAARTARERKPEIVNNFSSARHASVFEGVPLGRRQGETIQKIMSAPILDGNEVLGVIQISRKGHSSTDSGPDFTHNEIIELSSLSSALELFLKLCQIE
jgi:GAF domain-containing protein